MSISNDELNTMDEGTAARYNSTFQTWPQEDIEKYWIIVDKFNQEFNPATYKPETNQL